MQTRYGIPFSSQTTPQGHANTAASSGLVRGSTAAAPNPLPRSTANFNTHDYTAALLTCLDHEVKRGLLHLSNRGLLPPCADITSALTGQSNVLHTQAMHLLPHEDRFIASPGVHEAAKEYGLYSRVSARRFKAAQATQEEAAALSATPPNTAPGPQQFPARDHSDSGSSSGGSSAGTSDAAQTDDLGAHTPGHPAPTHGSRKHTPAAGSAGRPPRGPTATRACAAADPVVVTRLAADAKQGSVAMGDADVGPEQDQGCHGGPREAETARGAPGAVRFAGQLEVESSWEALGHDGSSAGPPGAVSSASGIIDVGVGGACGGGGGPALHSAGDAAAAVDGADMRHYEDLMDDLSAHHVIIRKGQVLNATPEYQSFQRTCGDAWPAVAAVLLQLEAICVQYAVPLATVFGARVLELGQEAAAAGGGAGAAPALTVERLLGCIENIQEVALVLQQPGQRFRGPNGRAAAVVLIQAFMRGLHARRVRTFRTRSAFQVCWRCLEVLEVAVVGIHQSCLDVLDMATRI